MKILSFATLVALMVSFSPLAAQAQVAPQDKNSYISAGLGVWDIGDDDDAADFRLEYRPDSTLFWKIKPWVGTEITSDWSTWTGAGILADFYLDDEESIYLTPSFGAGLYTQGSSDLDLGSVIEFRSQIEGGFEFENAHRVGVAFGHISNASIDEDNPGTEILNVYYHVPVNDLF